ncbi:hypothetical protein MRB53_008792 [Persea americana]|uniref:Uncharacterized protein n=1 Tax=Persea americana TaxID=3435 RepID=A0ACC2LMB8_PERAE|nr:hypothetical protein MRB53_008792 [Persea americana]
MSFESKPDLEHELHSTIALLNCCRPEEETEEEDNEEEEQVEQPAEGGISGSGSSSSSEAAAENVASTPLNTPSHAQGRIRREPAWMGDYVIGEGLFEEEEMMHQLVMFQTSLLN